MKLQKKQNTGGNIETNSIFALIKYMAYKIREKLVNNTPSVGGRGNTEKNIYFFAVRTSVSDSGRLGEKKKSKVAQ